MCWNFRERRPPPNVSPGICCKCLCMPVKMHAKLPVCFNFFTFYPVCTKIPWTQNIFLQIICLFCFWNCYFLAGKLLHKPGAKKFKISYRWFHVSI
jgi:hypothetical protein